ncbi:DJ-1/PfpI family protein [Fimicolochytrium jonesii]|uniref:DJ-1/PfpI family protein n=1 Tax=Fimicolochytrium jonesii TaxID=1396493 RepID=UPI0022FF238B|nr:DJ-1/PfpI family protein [Fimicolochytrium jonesii]KAI8819421.1 DJ-1/PfpI family protein [Fimicolochytrium jonesii]
MFFKTPALLVLAALIGIAQAAPQPVRTVSLNGTSPTPIPSNQPNPPTPAAGNSTATRSFGMLLYPGFTALDVFGPLEWLNMLSTSHNITLSLISTTNSTNLTGISSLAQGTPMSMSLTGAVGETILPTHTLLTAPKLDILIVPGGLGTRSEVNNTDISAFINARYPELEYLLSVCTGAALLAKSGVLDGRRATGTKFSWKFITGQSDKVEWVPRARWVEDGNVLTSSGVTAGMDMMYYFVGKLYGEKLATRLTNVIEYIPIKNSTFDPFADIWNVTSSTMA